MRITREQVRFDVRCNIFYTPITSCMPCGALFIWYMYKQMFCTKLYFSSFLCNIFFNNNQIKNKGREKHYNLWPSYKEPIKTKAFRQRCCISILRCQSFTQQTWLNAWCEETCRAHLQCYLFTTSSFIWVRINIILYFSSYNIKGAHLYIVLLKVNYCITQVPTECSVRSLTNTTRSFDIRYRSNGAKSSLIHVKNIQIMDFLGCTTTWIC